MKRFFIRWFLLNKRIFKKPVFVLILCAVPFLVFALGLVSSNNDGFMNIAIVLEDTEDELSKAIGSELIGSSSIVRFIMCDSADEAEDQVRYGEADAAWIISDRLGDAVDDFANDRAAVCATVIEREETVALSLCREKLSAALSYEMSFDLMRSEFGKKVSAELTEDELRGYYDGAFSVDELFEFRRTSGEIIDYSDSSYLMLPMRGMLAVAILLCGFAMAMFWMYDERQMVFYRVSGAARPAFELGYHLTGILDIAVIVLISIYLSGLWTGFLHEAAALAVYCLNCAVFVILIRRLLRSIRTIAAVTPLIIVLVIVVNPILINLPFVYPLRILTPVYYYLQSANDASFILYGLIYFAVFAAADLLLSVVSDRSLSKPGAA